MIETLQCRKIVKGIIKTKVVLFGFLGFLILLSGCHNISLSRQAKVPNFNILLISIDTLRADHLGCYGYKEIQTPVIDQVAREGALFSHCYTPTPVTLPSHLSIMTGLYPLSHGVRNNGTFVAGPELVTLAEVLKERGYQTAAFVGSFVLDRRFGLDQGFDTFDDYMNKDQEATLLLYNERKAEDVVSGAEKWLRTNGRNKPFFLWVHCFDPHAPYEPPQPFATKYKDNLYDGEIAYTDQMLGKLISCLKEMNIWDQTLLILTADHGEGLGEHNEKTHAIFIYDSTLRVPLIFRHPGLIPQNVEISQEVTLLDIFPTVLELAGVKKEIDIHGKSLMGLMTGKENKPLREEFFCETYYPLYNHGWSPLEGLRTKEWVYIRAPKPELYNMIEDRGQVKNLYPSHRQKAEELDKQMEALKRRIARGKVESKKMVMDQETAQRLRSLGYVATVHEKAENETSGLYPDPKDMIGTLDYLNMGTYYFSQGDTDKAIEQFLAVLKVNPNDVFTHFVLGYIYDQIGKTDLAIKEFEETLRLDPRYVSAYNDLGTVYNRLGQYDKALEQFRKALELNPDYTESVENMGVVYFAMKEYDQALKYFEQSLRMNPKNHKAYNNIGSVYLAWGDYQKAKEYLEKAHQMNPQYIDAYNNLGSVLISLGEFDQAIEKFQGLLKLNPKHIEGRINLASAYIAKERYEEALRELEEAQKINPNISKIYNCLGSLYVRSGKFAEAVPQFQKTLALDPNSFEAHYNLGIAYFRLGELDSSIKEYQEALRLNPSNASCHVNLGIAYFNQQKIDECIAEYQKALQLDPRNVEAAINLGVAYYTQGKYDLALQSYLAAESLSPNNLQVHVNLGMTYFAQGLLDQAEQEYKKGLEIAPTCLEALINLAILYANLAKYDQAISYYQEAVRLYPQSHLAYYGLGYCYFLKGEIDQAIEVLQKAIQLQPSYIDAQMLLDKVVEAKGKK
ncbi:MAG: tetratricopeptide repeat protein [bacterium]|nr:tetratricopeptide repeat protein [bacterium]